MTQYSGTGRSRADVEREEPAPAAETDQQLPEAAVMPVSGLIDGLSPLRRHASTDALGGTDVSATVAQELRRRRGGGDALPGNIAGPMAEHFGTDLSDVRVHADPGAGVLARSIDAAAFTHGNDIYFAPGAYRPGSPDGQRVLAHELSHVAAQRSGTDRAGSGSLTIGRADDPAEAAADRSADRAMSALRRTPASAGAEHADRPGHPEHTDSAGSDLDPTTGLEIRRWRWPWESKSKSKSKDKGSKDSKTKGSTSKGSKSKESKGSKSKGAKGSDTTSVSQPTLPPTAPTITEDTKDTGPTTPQAPPQPTVTTGEDTKSESTETEQPTVIEDTKDTGPTTPQAPPQPTVTTGEDTKDGGTIPQAPPQPTVTTGEDTKDTGTSSSTSSTDVKTETGPETTTATESKDTTPTVETPVVTYPRVFTIGKEQIEVASAEQEVEADQILSDLKDKYGLDLASTTTISAIKKDYKGVPKKVTSKLQVSVWSMQELRALQEAAIYYAPILGSQRETSNLKGTVQGVTTVGKVKNAIDQGGKKGKLDNTTVGEYFSSSKNLALFDAGTNYEDKDYVREGKDKTDVQTSLSATAVHEMAHALVEPTELSSWVATFDYWADEDTKSGKKGAEGPPSSYGRTSAAEDLCESVSMYFINRPQLKKLCPGRDAFVDKVVKAWKPPQVDKVLETAAESPGSETPPSESEAKD